MYVYLVQFESSGIFGKCVLAQRASIPRCLRQSKTLVLRVTMGTKRDKCHKLRSYCYDVENYYVSMM